jgi:hypothetical protein
VHWLVRLEDPQKLFCPILYSLASPVPIYRAGVCARGIGSQNKSVKGTNHACLSVKIAYVHRHSGIGGKPSLDKKKTKAMRNDPDPGMADA